MTTIARRALQIRQSPGIDLYLFTLSSDEILDLADVSRVSRDDIGELIGYQRAAVRKHVDEIVEYLRLEEALMPNSIVLAMTPDVRFTSSRGPNVSDGLATAGTLEIPVPEPGSRKPAWIVDGQQRALALQKSERQGFAVPVSAFIADTVDLQRDQFIRVNNTKPLPRGLVTELLPQVSTHLPARLAAKKLPSALVDELNRSDESPFQELVRRASTEGARGAVVTDTGLVKAIEESLHNSSGVLFPYRDLNTGETDIEGVWRTLVVYWSAVRETFPEAWGKPAAKSRLMHGVGIRSMARLMDRLMAPIDPRSDHAAERALHELEVVAPHCRWTSGRWDELDLAWNEVQNVPKHISLMSNHLIRVYLQGSGGA